MKDANLKLLSLFMSLLLFVFVHSDINRSKIGLVVPIEVKNLPPSKIIVSQSAYQAQVGIQGPSPLVSWIPYAPRTFKVKIPDDVGGRYVAELSRSDLDLPFYAEVVNVEPATIEFNVENLVSRDVPVVVPKTGNISLGYKLEELQIFPERVKLTGPESDLKGIASIETEAIDLRTVKENSKRTLSLVPVGSHTQASVSQVNVSVNVAPIIEKKRFSSVPVKVRSTSEVEYVASPALISVEISGPQENMSKLNVNELLPYVVVTDDQHLEGLKVIIDLPDQFSLVSTEPDVVTASIPRNAALNKGGSVRILSPSKDIKRGMSVGRKN